jgi:putative oxygen-independent coproporphyrinogen III oxidase
MAFGVYIHWPFCASKCPYCDFNSYVYDTIDQSQWINAYQNEIRHMASLTTGRTVDTIFFGGGTPSLMMPDTVKAVINAVKENWVLSPNAEITLEANPTSVEAKKFVGFREAGVNRVSLGVQSLNETDLKFLGRTHDVDQAKEAVHIARDTFDRFSFDLIYARPHQTVTAWRDELMMALDMAVEHLSLYQLTIEKNTPFHLQYHRGEFQISDQDLAADLYDVTQEILNNAGLPAYEVSNHARAGEESRHNLIYWQSDDYIGIGPGAHGRLTIDSARSATRAHRAPDIWLNRTLEIGHGQHEFESLSIRQSFEEMVMMGLRLRQGIPWSKLVNCSPELAEKLKYSKALTRMINESYLVQNSDDLVTTPEGLKRLNAVLGYILTD